MVKNISQQLEYMCGLVFGGGLLKSLPLNSLNLILAIIQTLFIHLKVYVFSTKKGFLISRLLHNILAHRYDKFSSKTKDKHNHENQRAYAYFKLEVKTSEFGPPISHLTDPEFEESLFYHVLKRLPRISLQISVKFLHKLLLNKFGDHHALGKR